ncbi:MAG: hypothetical protein KGJ64_03045 [Betaproteobacteria bacterium]|nr:hypothetical protein [Betaproteobacteria bacterium]
MCRRQPFDAQAYGVHWSPSAETMVGLKRLESIEHCVKPVLADRVPGNLVETGMWRGGSCILMRQAWGVTDRSVWLADSFAALPQSYHQEDVRWDFEQSRQQYGITEPIQTVDQSCVYWRRSSPG